MKVKKVLSLVLALTLVFSMIPIQLITSAGIESTVGDATDVSVDVSIADTSAGKYAGCIDVALRITQDYTKLPTNKDKTLTQFNQIITIDPTVVSTVKKSPSSQRGNPNMQDILDAVSESSKKFIDASSNWAVIAADIPTEDDPEAETVTFDMTSTTVLAYNENLGKVLIQLNGSNSGGYLNYDEIDKPSFIVAHLYLKPQEGKTLAECKNAINLATQADIDDAGTPGVMDDLSYISSKNEASVAPNSVGITFTPDFDPVAQTWTITFTGIKNADGSAADDDVQTVNDGDPVTAPELADYNDGNFPYTANGWDQDVVSPAVADATYTAVYTKTKNDVTSLAGEVSDDEALKEEDYQGGWDNFATALAAAQAVLANNESTDPAEWPNATQIDTALNNLVDARRSLVPLDVMYDITFNWQTAAGLQSTTKQVKEGDQITAPAGSEADIDAATYTQAFEGWMDATGTVVDLPECSGEATFTAKYGDPVAKTVELTFNYRGADADWATPYVIAAELGADAATYAPDAQTVTTADGNTTYEFTGWSPALGTVSADVTEYTAQYTEIENKADYTAVENALTAANEKMAEDGYAKKYTKAAQDALTDAINAVEYDLPFSEQTRVDQMAEAILAALDMDLQDYTITYVVPNSDPTQETFYYGDSADAVAAKAPAAPESYDDGDYHYTLTGWSPDFAAVDGNATYTAQYDSAFVPADTSALQTAVNTKIAERDSGTEWTDESVAALNQKLGEAEQYLNPPAPIGQSQQGAIDALTNAIKNSTLVPKGQPATTYTIVFQDWDGSEIYTQTVNAGDTITVPENPTRPDSQDGNTSYTFTGWGKDVVMVPTQDETYTAQYSETTNYADLTALKDAISAAQQKQAEENFNDKYANAAAFNALVSDAQALVDSTPLKSQQGDVDAKAGELNNFELVPNQFTITFITHEGAAESVVKYGETPVAPATPNYTENDYEYSFLQWTVDQQPAEIVPATANVTYVAKYSSQFLPADYDANDAAVQAAQDILNTENVDKIYTADTLAALQDAVNNNVQPGLGVSHQQEVDAATTAINDAINGLEKIVYTVNFYVEGQAEPYATGTYEYNQDLVVPSDPVKQADDTYTYAFAGWDPQISEKVTESVDYHGSFDPTYKEYTVAFEDEDGTPIISGTYHWGDAIQTPADPTKQPDETYTYNFAGWTPEVVPCAGDATYTATYNATYIDYTVKFVVDGQDYDTQTLHYGDPVVIPENPTKAPSASTVYTFDKWEPAVVDTCQGNATYTAQFDESVRMYDITVVTKDPTDATDVTDTMSVAYGDTPNLTDPVSGFVVNSVKYTFTGWDPQPAPVDGEATYTALYDQTPVVAPTYTINFKYADTAEEAESGNYADHAVVMEEGDMPSIPTPSDFTTATATYTFIDWDKQVGPAQEDTTYTAQYKVTPIVTVWTINFRYSESLEQVEDGHLEDHIQKVNDGDMPNIPPAQSFTDGNTKYTFDGWGKTVVAATGDAVYTAVYKVETVFIPDMSEVKELFKRYKEMVKSGQYVKEDLDIIKAYIDDIYDKLDKNEFTEQSQVDEMATYLRYLEDHCRKIDDGGGKDSGRTDSKGRSSSRSARTGDNASLVVMSVILVSSIGLAVVTLKKRKREDF